MKIAAAIAANHNANDAVKAAESRAIAKDDNWEEGVTTYTFNDNSLLLISGPSICAVDADSRDSIKAAHWLMHPKESARLLAELV